MVLLLQKLSHSLHLPFRLDHQGLDSEALSASFITFQSNISRFLNPIISKSKPGSDFLSLEWIQLCLDTIPLIHKAFSKLVVDIDYPINQWKSSVSKEYLSYSLIVLDLLNKVGSSLSHLAHARVSLFHALSPLENSPSSGLKHLQEIGPNTPESRFKMEEMEKKKESHGFGKEMIFHEALMIMRSTVMLLLGIIASGLSSDRRTYSDMRISALESHDPALEKLDFVINQELENRGCIAKEVKEINRAVAGIEQLNGKDDGGIQELSQKLEVLERLLQSLEKKKEGLFSDVLASRNKLLETFRQKLEN